MCRRDHGQCAGRTVPCARGQDAGEAAGRGWGHDEGNPPAGVARARCRPAPRRRETTAGSAGVEAGEKVAGPGDALRVGVQAERDTAGEGLPRLPRPARGQQRVAQMDEMPALQGGVAAFAGDRRGGAEVVDGLRAGSPGQSRGVIIRILEVPAGRPGGPLRPAGEGRCQWSPVVSFLSRRSGVTVPLCRAAPA